jgi:hypothetical protein
MIKLERAERTSTIMLVAASATGSLEYSCTQAQIRYGPGVSTSAVPLAV